MGDNKQKRGNPDRYLISFKEKYEVDYAAKQLQKQVPETTRQEARDALSAVATQISARRTQRGREKDQPERGQREDHAGGAQATARLSSKHGATPGLYRPLAASW